MARCRRCGAKAVITMDGESLCASHFKERFLRKIESTIKKYGLVRTNEKIGVAVSGGKDSSALLHSLNMILDETPVAIFLDLGIEGYSDTCLRNVRELCARIGAELKVFQVREMYGFTVSEAVARLRRHRTPCSICGMIKRRALNDAALELGVDKLATGHTLDDEVTFLLVNYASGDLDLLARSGPFSPSKYGKLVARIKPLYETTERETEAYCKVNNIPYTKAKCPYSATAPTIRLKKAVAQLDEARPGFRASLLRSFNKSIKPVIRSYWAEREKTLFCRKCGYPTTKEICGFCRLRAIVTRI